VSNKLNKESEIEQIQDYLTRFGYIDSPILDKFGISRTLIQPESVTKGTYDEGTKNALKKFQEFNHLEVTGELDENTKALMGKPRCGFPDISAEFATTGRRWPHNNLTYGFQNFTADLSQDQIIQALEQAFSLWSAETPLTFTRIAATSNPDIVIRFVTGDHGDGSPFDGPGNVLAHAFYPPVPPNPIQPIEGDAHFDDAETWTVTIPNPANTFDLVTVAAHEIGHSLGLAHSTVTNSLMQAFYGGPHRFLHQDDISGIQTVYGGYPIANASWIHGSSIQVEIPEQIESIRRFGFYTRIIGKPNTSNWFHFAIPSSAIVDDDRKLVGPVILRFRTGSTIAVVRDVHIYDGSARIMAHNGVNLSGNNFFSKFGVAHSPPALWGVGVSIGVNFGNGTSIERSMDFIAAGCDFRP
jgi:peptidoglycan hydrolase-like protein with peptidoglycan-binding domain